MNTDDFEKWLRWQKTRRIPGDWRAEILRAAESSRPEVLESRLSFLSTLRSQLSTILWPHPKAWAGLGAAWVLIFALQFSARDPAPRRAQDSAPPSPELVMRLKDQQRMLAELLGNNEPRPAAKPARFEPRSERREGQLVT